MPVRRSHKLQERRANAEAVEAVPETGGENRVEIDSATHADVPPSIQAIAEPSAERRDSAENVGGKTMFLLSVCKYSRAKYQQDDDYSEPLNSSRSLDRCARVARVSSFHAFPHKYEAVWPKD